MSQEEAVQHWRKGAQEAKRWAEKMAKEGSNALALFHCHLAIEKALKATYMEQKKEPAPYTHSLMHLASLLDVQWTKKDLTDLQELSPFSSQARYDDIGWVEEEATKEYVDHWLKQSENFLTRLRCT